ncbi:galactokinase [Staphylococcus massiliensis]|uniref:Galactokinase n=1 Tax=Staphylococcus massiliensis S46 TaxID=1229783 RepID=K9ANL8_9STAP|nr:galactokinase [Staphylococcus massiliensis]EKU48958.1 galactokinase [Staphylococcus massiliensis S46]MCG3399398.1 galactokinase [Staphylococcus massiliensis]MCG3402501.1 galactokinase [Staphylococcus massiliensis]MCG3411534.1 galactokinase [Staphylococcus massiliensis]PNZ98760.1 galactokinase [Staphylococcus massiliensis CCUG 55927]
MTIQMTDLVAQFEQRFKRDARIGGFSPGRVNLIGEHIDYNGGHVFPVAIDIGTYGVAAPRMDRTVRVYSNNMKDCGVITFDLEDLSYKDADHYANYIKGMLLYLKEVAPQLDHGFDLLIEGNLPYGASLSSSASLEMLVGRLMIEMFQIEMPLMDLVQIGKRVENAYIGVNSGIMDQFIIAFGKASTAFLLDTHTLKYDEIKTHFEPYQLVIMNTNKSRELKTSKYNERRSECEEALKQLQSECDINALCELDVATFEQHQHMIKDDVLRRRARHAVLENDRTRQVCEALNQGDYETYGQLLNASHASLKSDFEVTGIELDTLAEAAQQQQGCIGARMTGGGFVGCAIAFVHHDHIETFKEAVTTVYTNKIGYPPSFYVVNVSDGAKIIEIS